MNPQEIASIDFQRERDYEAFKALLALWQSENPIKTNKLQMLLLVNALLISAVAIAGGLSAELWYVCVAGIVFSAVWALSIGRTSLFQDLWQARLAELQRKYADDPRFSVLDVKSRRPRASPLTRTFGAVPSSWYLLATPAALTLAWAVALVLAQ